MEDRLLTGHILPKRNLFDGEQIIPMGTTSFYRKTLKGLQDWVKAVKPNIIKEHEPEGESYGTIVDVFEQEDGIYISWEPTEVCWDLYEKKQLKFVSCHILWDHQADDYDPAIDNSWFAALVEVSLVGVPRFAVGQQFIGEAYVPSGETKALIDQIEDEDFINTPLALIAKGRAITESQYSLVASGFPEVANSLRKVRLGASAPNRPVSKENAPFQDPVSLDAGQQALVSEALTPNPIKLKYNQTRGEAMTEKELTEMLEAKLAEAIEKMAEEKTSYEAEFMEKYNALEAKLSALQESFDSMAPEAPVEPLEASEDEEVLEMPEGDSEPSEGTEELSDDLMKRMTSKIEELEARLAEYEVIEADREFEEAGVEEEELKATLLSLRKRDRNSYQVMLSAYAKAKPAAAKGVRPAQVKLSGVAKDSYRTEVERVAELMKSGKSFAEASKLVK